MKKIFTKITLSLLIIISLIACSSDSDTLTQNPTPCSPGYSGTYCNIPITPTKIKITKFKVTNFPNITSNGFNWDGGSNNEIYPDIFVQIGNNVLPIYYNDVLSTGSNSFEFIPAAAIEITNVNNLHTVYLGDYDLNDSPSNANDLMGQIEFYPYQAINGFPTTLMLSNNQTSVAFKVELTLTYEW